MRRLLLAFLTLALAGSLAADDKDEPPRPIRVTFFIANADCPPCVEAITAGIRKVRSVMSVEGLSPQSGCAVVTLDTRVSSFHQVALAVAATPPLHGAAYEATVRFRIPQYGEGDNAARVDAVFRTLEDRVHIEPLDREQGLFVLAFHPMKLDLKAKKPQGFNGGHLTRPIRDALGLKLQYVRQLALPE
jgi:copper chaperone CopZ